MDFKFEWNFSEDNNSKKKKKSSKGITMVKPEKKEEPPVQNNSFAPFDIGSQISYTPSAAQSYTFANIDSDELMRTLTGGSVINLPFDEPSDSKKDKKKSNTDTIEYSERELTDAETNTPSIEKYSITNALLMNTINQIEIGLSALNEDSQVLRRSNDRKKYEYLSQIHSTMGSYLNNKISAIRELNSVMTKCQDYDYKREKDLRLVAASKDDDGTVLQDYKAFVNMPRGNADFIPLGPSSADMTIFGNVNGFNVGNQMGYEQYVNSMTPTQHMMQLESDPNVQQVLFYDTRTGRKWFDVVDIRTNQHIPNTETYDPMLLDEFDIDLNKGIARCINFGLTLPLIVIQDESLQYY